MPPQTPQMPPQTPQNATKTDRVGATKRHISIYGCGVCGAPTVVWRGVWLMNEQPNPLDTAIAAALLLAALCAILAVHPHPQADVRGVNVAAVGVVP